MKCKNNIVVHVLGYGLGALLLAARLAADHCVIVTPLGILGLRFNTEEAAHAASLLPLRAHLAARLSGWLGARGVAETPRLYRIALRRVSRLVPLVSINYRVWARNTVLVYYAVCPPRHPPSEGVERLYTCTCGRSILYGVIEPREDCNCISTDACVTGSDLLVIIEPPRSVYVIPPGERTLSSIDEFIEEYWGSVLTRLSMGGASDPRSVAIPR